MSQTRELTRTPGTLGPMLRAALALVPGAFALPFVPGGAGEVPELTLKLSRARLDPARLDTYRRLCGFEAGVSLPATAPHLLAFPLHMALMSDPAFPFAAVGLVHLHNTIVVRRALGVQEPLDLSVRASTLGDHAKGRTFTIVTEARVGEELVWEEHSTMLHRLTATATPPERVSGDTVGPPSTAEWSLPADLGRRYARVSGDRNPIHLCALSAKPFGFQRAIAHGMWTKARCLAALASTLADAYTVQVSFRKPILLPGRVAFANDETNGTQRFVVRSPADESRVHLEGAVTR